MGHSKLNKRVSFDKEKERREWDLKIAERNRAGISSRSHYIFILFIAFAYLASTNVWIYRNLGLSYTYTLAGHDDSK